jgi:hypothetical protein
MSQYRLHWSATIWLILPALMLLPLHVSAQNAQHATLALVNALADSTATATIIRESGPQGRTLILVREQDANAATIATALASLSGSRQRHGDTLANELVINLRGRRSASSLSSAEQRVLEDYVSRLRTAKIDSLAGYGQARTLVIPLAPLGRAISPRPGKA